MLSHLESPIQHHKLLVADESQWIRSKHCWVINITIGRHPISVNPHPSCTAGALGATHATARGWKAHGEGLLLPQDAPARSASGAKQSSVSGPQGVSDQAVVISGGTVKQLMVSSWLINGL